MENKQDIEKSDIQRGSVINVSTRCLPEQLKKAQELYEIDDMERYNDDLDVYNYSNWKVFEIIGRINPRKYGQYPSLYKLLLDIKSEGNDMGVLILHKQETQKAKEMWSRNLDKACDIFDVLVNGIKKSKNDFYNLAQKYRSEIASLFGNNNDDILRMMEVFGQLAEDYEEGKISNQELEDGLEGFKSIAQSYKSLPLTSNAIHYMKGSKARIKELKNKFLENGSNVYVVN